MPSLWHSLNFYAQFALVVLAAAGFIPLCGWILACVADAFDDTGISQVLPFKRR